MSAPRIARPVAALALAAAIGGCRNDDLTLGDVHGTYVPAPTASSYFNPLVSDTMWFGNAAPMDRAVNMGIQKVTDLVLRAAAAPGSAPDSQVTYLQSFRFDVDDDEVLVFHECVIDACLTSPTLRGPLVGDVLTLRPRPEMSSLPRTYVRVARP